MYDKNQNSVLRCFNRCGNTDVYPVDAVVYRCPTCNGLLEVQHNLEQLKTRSAEKWKALLDLRNRCRTFPFDSGVWRYREWVMPDLADEHIVSMYEGNTTLFRASRFGKELGLDELWVKMCGNSHTGSFKDLGMTVLVSVVNGIVQRGGSNIKAVACASTGDTSAALAAYAATAGIPAIIFLPKDKISPAQLIQPTANGAHVLVLDTDFDGCMKVVQDVTADQSIYLANSMNSLRIEGQQTVAMEIVQQFDWEVPDWVIVPSGNLGNISAMYKGFRLMQKLGVIDRIPRLVAAQTEKANPLYQNFLNGFVGYKPVIAEATLASAIQIGNPVSYDKAVQAIQESDGLVVSVTEQELAHASAQADRSGMYTCPHTGVALAALIQLVKQKQIQQDDRTVVLSTALGLKFTQFKTGYHASSLNEVKSKLANPQHPIPATKQDVENTIARILGLGQHQVETEPGCTINPAHTDHADVRSVSSNGVTSRAAVLPIG